MNPVPVMKLVEGIRGCATSDAVTRRVMDLSRELGKMPIEVNDHATGKVDATELPPAGRP